MYKRSSKVHLVVHLVAFVAVFALLVCGWGGYGWGMVAGQQSPEPDYDVLPLDQRFDIPDLRDADPRDAEEMRRLRDEIRQKNEYVRGLERRVTSMVRGDVPLAGDDFDQFFRNRYFAPMTKTDPRRMGEYADLRIHFFRTYMSRSSGAVRDRLLQLTFDTMSQVARGNFHPAARVNALVIIGQLDSRRGERGGNPPIPYQPSLGFLLDVIENENSPEYANVAAMAGIQRHAELRPLGTGNAFSEAERNRIGQRMVQVLNPAVLTNRQTRDATYWKRRRAAQTLGAMRDPGNDNRFARELRDVIANQDEPLWLRHDAIVAYSQLLFNNANDSDAFTVAKSGAGLIAELAKKDAQFIEHSILSIKEVAQFLDEEDPLSDGDDRRAGSDDREVFQFNPFEGGGQGGGDAADQDRPGANEILPVYQRQIVRQRVKTVVYAVRELLEPHEDQPLRNGGMLAYARQSNGQDSAEARLLAQLRDELDKLMRSMDVVDMRRVPARTQETETDHRTRAEKLKDALLAGAESIEALLEPERAPAESAPGADVADAPADTQEAANDAADDELAEDEDQGENR